MVALQVITNHCPPKPPRRAKSRDDDDGPCSTNEGTGIAAAVHTACSMAPGYVVESTGSVIPDSGMYEDTSDTSGLLSSAANAWAQAAPSDTSSESARITGTTNKRHGCGPGAIPPMRLDLNGVAGQPYGPSSSDCAPLASPEAMSDTYSICSRASSVRNSTNYPSGLGGLAADSVAAALQSRTASAVAVQSTFAGASTSRAVSHTVNPAITTVAAQNIDAEFNSGRDLALNGPTVGATEVSGNDISLPLPVNVTDLMSKLSPSTDDGSSGTFDVLGAELPGADNLSVCGGSSVVRDGDTVARPATLTQSDSGIYCDNAPNGFATHTEPNKPDAMYVPCVPDFCNQHLYDDTLGHYSAAGRGYPHGAYMSTSPNVKVIRSSASHKALPRSVSLYSDSVNNNSSVIDNSKSTNVLNTSEDVAVDNTKSASINSLNACVTVSVTAPLDTLE